MVDNSIFQDKYMREDYILKINFKFMSRVRCYCCQAFCSGELKVIVHESNCYLCEQIRIHKGNR